MDKTKIVVLALFLVAAPWGALADYTEGGEVHTSLLFGGVGGDVGDVTSITGCVTAHTHGTHGHLGWTRSTKNVRAAGLPGWEEGNPGVTTGQGHRHEHTHTAQGMTQDTVTSSTELRKACPDGAAADHHSHGGHTHVMHGPATVTDADDGHDHDGTYSPTGHNHDRSYAAREHSHTGYATVSALDDYVLQADKANHTHSGFGPKWLVPVFYADAFLWMLNRDSREVMVEVHARGQDGSRVADTPCWSGEIGAYALGRIRRSDDDWGCDGSGAWSVEVRADEEDSPSAKLFVVASRRFGDSFAILPAVRFD